MLNARLYSNREAQSFSWDSVINTSIRPLSANFENVVQAVVDTLVARVGSMQPKATVYTRGADFGVYSRGRLLDKYLWGQFKALGIHSLGRQVFRDALVYGTGFLKIGVAGDDICAERVNPDEVVIDQRECVSGQYPQQFHHRRLTSKAALKAKFSSKEAHAAIDELNMKQVYTSYRTPIDNAVVVIESWKMPSADGADDGKHVVCTENFTLLEESYECSRAPFIALRWADGLYGYYGRSVVSDVIGYQIQLNKLNEMIHWGQDVMCVPRLLVEQGSQVLVDRIDNQMAKVLRYRGVKPEAVVWPAFNTEIYNERERVWNRALESQGISQMASMNKMPSQFRADSSEAIRELNSTNDDRFNDRVQAIEEWYLRVAECIVDCAAELHAGEKPSAVRFRSGNVVEQLDWTEVNLEKDKYVMQITASSVLNMSPAARKDKLDHWLERGVVSMDEYKSMSGEPDLEHLAEQGAASYDAVGAQVDSMLKGQRQQPDPHMNLGAGMMCVVNTYLHILSLEAPEDVLDCFRNWMLSAEAMMNAQPEAPAAPGAPMMAPAPAGSQMMPGAVGGMPGAAMGAAPVAPTPGAF